MTAQRRRTAAHAWFDAAIWFAVSLATLIGPFDQFAVWLGAIAFGLTLGEALERTARWLDRPMSHVPSKIRLMWAIWRGHTVIYRAEITPGATGARSDSRAAHYVDCYFHDTPALDRHVRLAERRSTLWRH